MTQLTAAQLSQIRTRPQQTKLHLSLFSPSTVLACRSTGSPVKDDRVISYNNVTSGSFTSVESGMTLLVGTAPGGFDKGRVRVRSITSNQITVAENSHIDWSNNLYLTVIKYWEVWPVFPRIIQNPSNDEDVIFYKDYDIAYTNQNSILGTFVCSGPHRAKYIDNGQATVFYSSSGTSNLLGGSVGHFWEFEGGSPSVFAGAEPGTVTYTNPGHYVTKHTVTGSNGASDVSYRYVSIYPRPTANNPTTIQDFTIDSIDGSRDSGGYTAKIKIHQNITNQIIPGTVVVIFSENLYGGTPRSLGGNSIGNEDIFFVGYVLDDAISYNYETSDIELNVGSITELMKIAEGFSVSVEDSKSPNTWYKLLGMNCRRAIYHYLKWHSTVLGLADFEFRGTDRAIQFFDADRESLFDGINSFLSSTLVGELVSDRQGKLWAEVSGKADPTLVTPVIMTLDKNDWIGAPSFQENINEKVSYLEMGGVAYSGATTGTFSALMANSPGSAPSYRGKVQRNQGLALGSQSQLNQLVGNIFANKNNRFPSFDVSLAGTYLNLDIAPQHGIKTNILPNDTVKNISITGTYIVQSASWSIDSENLMIMPRIGFQEIVSGQSASTISIPDVPPGGGFSTPNFPIPSLSLPSSSFPLQPDYFFCQFSRQRTYPSNSSLLCLFDQRQSGGNPIVSISGTSTSVFERIPFIRTGLYLVSINAVLGSTIIPPFSSSNPPSLIIFSSATSVHLDTTLYPALLSSDSQRAYFTTSILLRINGVTSPLNDFRISVNCPVRAIWGGEFENPETSPSYDQLIITRLGNI